MKLVFDVLWKEEAMSVFVGQFGPQGGRRVGVRKARPGAGVSPTAHPLRPIAPRGVSSAAACRGVAQSTAAAAEVWLTVKVALVILLLLAGAGTAVLGFVSWVNPDPSVTYVQGDAAWAHVDAWR